MPRGGSHAKKRKGIEQLPSQRKHFRFTEEGNMIDVSDHNHRNKDAVYSFPSPQRPMSDDSQMLTGFRKYWPRRLVWSFLRQLFRCSCIRAEEINSATSFVPTLLSPWKDSKIVSLKAEYSSLEDYQVAWTTLLLMETLESIRSYRCDASDDGVPGTRWQSRIDTRRDRIQGVVQSQRFSLSDGCPGKLLILRLQLAHNQELSDGDLLLISCSDGSQTTLGMVVAWDPDISVWTLDEERGSRYADVIVCEGTCPPDEGWLPRGSVRRGDELHMYFLANIITSVRECRAIDAITAIPSLAKIVNAVPDDTCATYPVEVPQRPKLMRECMWTAFLKEFNAKQVQAIECVCRASSTKPALDDMPVVLIQGPPGTGKTKTITGIIAAILEGAGRHPSLGPLPIQPGSSFGLPIQRHLLGVGPNKLRPYRTPSKILVCSPSNTAIDELIFRIKSCGILGGNGVLRRGEDVIVVRLGRRKSSETSSLQSFVDKSTLDNIVESQRSHFNSYYGESTNALRRCIIEEADIVCCTLSSVDSKGMIETLMGLDNFVFDCLIIDEATQAIEPSTLIPLKLCPRVIVLIGDPQQLRPTVLMQNRDLRSQYSMSLFERLMNRGFPVIRLQEQYRMHAAICQFPSQRYYDSSLLTAASIEARTPSPNFYTHPSGLFKPFVLHNVVGEETRKGSSLVNAAEVKYVLALYKRFRESYAKVENLEVGVICPYSAMRLELHQTFRSAFGSLDSITISTVDGFQGKEKDIIIFCCVRSRSSFENKDPQTIGFLGDRNRINVALTRAKYALWIVGDFEHLKRLDKEWESLVAHAKDTDSIVK